MERFTEVRAGAQDSVGAHVLMILGAIVVGDRPIYLLSIVAQAQIQRHGHSMRLFSTELSDFCEPSFSFNSPFHRNNLAA